MKWEERKRKINEESEENEGKRKRNGESGLQIYEQKNEYHLNRSKYKLTGHHGPVHCCQFSPNGEFLATAGYDRKVLLWDIFDHACPNVFSLNAHKHSIQQLKWCSDTEFLTCSADHSCALFDITTAERVQKFEDHLSIVNSTAVVRSHEHQGSFSFASASDDKTCKLWDFREKQSVLSFDHDFEVLSTEISCKGSEIITGGLDDVIRVWDSRKPLEPLYALTKHNDMITGLAVYNDSYLFSYDMRGEVGLWDVSPYLSPGKSASRLLSSTSYVEKLSSNFKSFHEKNLLKINCDRSGTVVGFGSVTDYSALLTNSASGEILHSLKDHSGAVFEVAFHPNNSNIVASCSMDGSAILQELQSRS